MSEFSTKLKAIMQRSAKFIGKNAKAAAHTTKYKVNEMSALSKRRELIGALGESVYALSQQGSCLPPEVLDMIEQIKALDANIEALRADHAAQKAAAAEKAAMEKAERAAKQTQAAMACAEDAEKTTESDAAKDNENDVLDYSCDADTADGEPETTEKV